MTKITEDAEGEDRRTSIYTKKKVFSAGNSEDEELKDEVDLAALSKISQSEVIKPMTPIKKMSTTVTNSNTLGNSMKNTADPKLQRRDTV
jgi:hypothetical protein